MGSTGKGLAVVALLTACAQPVELARTRPPAPSDGGQPAPDAEVLAPDAGPDGGPAPEPKPCLRDQGGPSLRGCAPGEVCHLPSGTCRPGRPCVEDRDCDGCSGFNGDDDCGHGFKLTAWCDLDHGSVCVRSRAPCEPCQEQECGRLDPVSGGRPLRCLRYEDGQRFCGRPCASGCPDGFECVGDQCLRQAGCVRNSVICPAAEPGASCEGTSQICAGTPCFEGSDVICATNDIPGGLGLCLGSCRSNDDCPPATPLCNPRNGICTLPCDKGNCSPDQTCHSDGLCWPGCQSDGECERRDLSTYCNQPGRSAPRAFKVYRDADSCAPLGCERAEDCREPGTICNLGANPPQCAAGCLSAADCPGGQACKAAPAGSYDPAACGSFRDRQSDDPIGVCCSPRCQDRAQDCDVNQFCCGEVGSPYEDPVACPSGVADGQCFDLRVDPFCVACTVGAACAASWPYGQGRDPAIDGGRPFDEQSLCFRVNGTRGLCGVGYNPERSDPGAPRGWSCGAVPVPCSNDADCGGLNCVGAHQDLGVSGVCQCGEDGIAFAPCPTEAPRLAEDVLRPRCRDIPRPPAEAANGDLFCIVGYLCAPVPNADLYPPACGL